MGTFVAVTDTVAECERRCLLSFEQCFGFTFAHAAGQCLLHYKYGLPFYIFKVFLLASQNFSNPVAQKPDAEGFDSGLLREECYSTSFLRILHAANI